MFSLFHALVLFTQTQWLSWSLTQTRLSTIVCSSTVSYWMVCPWTRTHMAASFIQSSRLTLWSQSTPQQKYVVSEASSLHCGGTNARILASLGITKQLVLLREWLLGWFFCKHSVRSLWRNKGSLLIKCIFIVFRDVYKHSYSSWQLDCLPALWVQIWFSCE